MSLDRTDFGILRLLQNNASLSNKEIAAAVGLAPSSAHERLKDLALDSFTNRPGVTRIETSIVYEARARHELPQLQELRMPNEQNVGNGTVASGQLSSRSRK